MKSVWLSVILLNILAVDSVFTQINKENISYYYNISCATVKYEYPIQYVSKKWQVARVSRKQYEIFNMIWRKTKPLSEFTSLRNNIDRKNLLHTTITHTSSPLTSYLPYILVLQSSTPSYIEFYYIDDNDMRFKRRDSTLSNSDSMNSRQNNNYADSSKDINHYPKLSFRANAPRLKHYPNPSNHKGDFINHDIKQNNVIGDKHNFYQLLIRQLRSKISKETPNLYTNTLKQKNFDEPKTYPTTFKDSQTKENFSIYNKQHNNLINNPNDTSLVTTPYDKIKFFEMYDKYTPMSLVKKVAHEDSEHIFKKSHIESEQSVMLQGLDKNTEDSSGQSPKVVKKHIREKNRLEQKIPESKAKVHIVNFRLNKSDGLSDMPEKHDKVLKNTKTIKAARNTSRPVPWSQYSFAAVYIYEPSEIHCDAAAISPHWLLAAGSCLSRYNRKGQMTEGRSAFVAYCNENWWHPERVSYVKYSIVHPRYHPRDKVRRYLYNIGLIQVVGSMVSACIGWAPISLMSHHFAAGTYGSMAAAVGWGVDRYDVKYTTSLPKVPLSLYEEVIYSSSCPGSTSYTKLKSQHDEVTKNIYCLFLPPYNGEEGDPIHGSMLLVGGKLIALYIQEERRPWGEQSAQYTGIWRLVPWVNEVAREPEDGDVLGLEI